MFSLNTNGGFQASQTFFAGTEAVAPLPAAQRAAGGGGVIASRREAVLGMLSVVQYCSSVVLSKTLSHQHDMSFA